MIEAQGLVKNLGNTRALNELSFTAPAGTVTGLLGPNGAGKSTTMRVLATLLRPDAGSVHIDGIDVAAHPEEVRRRIGLVTEEPGLYDRLTVYEQLEFAGRAYGIARQPLQSRLELVIDSLLLGDHVHKRAGTLSKGNRQKVALARAIVHDPPVLLLDEPTAALDVMATAGLEDLIGADHVTGGKTVLLSTHRLDEAERLSESIVGIVDGRVVAQGTAEEWARQAGTETFRDAFVTLLGGSRIA